MTTVHICFLKNWNITFRDSEELSFTLHLMSHAFALQKPGVENFTPTDTCVGFNLWKADKLLWFARLMSSISGTIWGAWISVQFLLRPAECVWLVIQNSKFCIRKNYFLSMFTYWRLEHKETKTLVLAQYQVNLWFPFMTCTSSIQF